MIKEFGCLLATIIAACLVMILHEIPKTILYKMKIKKEQPKVKILKFIDPVGLIFAVTGYCGFSKPYAYHVRNKKANLWIGYAGMLTLLVLFAGCVYSCKYVLSPVVIANNGNGIWEYMTTFLFWVVQYMGVISAGMFFTNLFPIVPFNMGNLIAGYSTAKYIAILKRDYDMKMFFFLIVIFGVIKTVSVLLFLLAYNF